MATIRDVLDRRRSRIGVVMLIGIALAIGGFVVGVATRTPPILALPGFAIFMFSMFYGVYGIHCPRCRGKIGLLLHSSSSRDPFRMPESVRFCPFCGVDLDSEAPEPKPK